MSGSTTTTSTTPNPLAEQQAQIAKQIGPKLLNNVLAGLSGSQTGQSFRQSQQANQSLRKSSARMGLSMGDPRFVQSLMKSREQATKPSQDITGLATSLYTGAPNVGPVSQGSKTSPGTADYAGMIISLLSLL